MSGSFASVGFHLGQDVQVSCTIYPGSKPILSLDICGAWVSITLAGSREPITSQDLATARELLAQVQKFVSECERMHAAQLAPSATDAAA
ncbi:hypothetical protein JYK22_00940, partial [Nonomuraea sp. RK-328]|nr:hypothetical protein [Nonomuraea sp. RK-328]